MKKIFKVGILIFVLVVPALVFLFLKLFGHNHYNIKTYYPLTDDREKVIIKEGDTVFHTIPAFSFRTQNGANISDKTFNNSIYVVDFFFSTCPNECPKMSSQLSRVQDAFEGAMDVKILSITVDPEHDSIKVLNDYANRYRAKQGMWYFATGSKENIYGLARNAFFISATVGDGGPTDFLHSQKFVLVDKNKHIRGYYNGMDAEDVDRLILEIKILQYEDKKS